jgi:hypothetical protein
LKFGAVTVLVDESRETFAKYGLGSSSWSHFLTPSGLMAVRKLGNEEGIWNRPTTSGSRWQRAGSFGLDVEGVVRWKYLEERADYLADFGEAVKVLDSIGKAHL